MVFFSLPDVCFFFFFFYLAIPIVRSDAQIPLFQSMLLFWGNESQHILIEFFSWDATTEFFERANPNTEFKALQKLFGKSILSMHRQHLKLNEEQKRNKFTTS